MLVSSCGFKLYINSSAEVKLKVLSHFFFLQQLFFNLHQRIAMAAAAISRSRVVAGGLCFFFTLLCLLCLATSHTDNNKLETIKENIRIIQQRLDKLKVQKATISGIWHGYIRFVDPMMAHLKEASEGSPDDSYIEEYIEKVKGLMEKTTIFVDGQNEKMDAEIKKTEQEVETMKKMIKAFEEYRAEL